MLELRFIDPSVLAKQKKNYNCATCKTHVQKVRRCEEDRWDFGPNDGVVFPIVLTKGSRQFGFCPAKATWDPEAVEMFNLLTVCCEMQQLPYAGGVAEQPAWFVEMLSWFMVQYNDTKFYNRAKSILGDGKSSGSIQSPIAGRGSNGSSKRRPSR